MINNIKYSEMEVSNKAEISAEIIRRQTELNPYLGIILGSGLADFIKNIENKKSIPYDEIPYFAKTGVEGHPGRLILGKISGLPVAAMQGRFHYYEGHTMTEVVFPVMVLYQLGIKTLIVTNAAGGINRDFESGDIMLIKDHINLMGINPVLTLIQDGMMHNKLEPFVNMTDVYDKQYILLAEETALKAGIILKNGILAAVQGPVYETPAEVEMLRRLGADAVCMSTIPEVIMAKALNIKILGVSLIANMAGSHTKHEDVVKKSEKNIDNFGKILTGLIEKI